MVKTETTGATRAMGKVTTRTTARTTTVKVQSDLRDRINRLAQARRSSANDLLSNALDRLEEHDFWQRQAAAHAALQADPALQEQIRAEAALWDNALLDDLSPRSQG